MAGERAYGDACAAARALDVVGSRWALLVARELLHGPKRFTDLRAGLPTASPNVLSQRLRELQRDGVVRRRALPPPAGSQVYELTEWGRELEPVMLALGRWGAGSPRPVPAAGMSVDAHLLAMRTAFDADAAAGLRARIELRLGDDRFRAHLDGGRLEMARGASERPDATISTDPGTLAAVLWGGRRLSEAMGAGDLRIEGDRRAAARFLGLFPPRGP